MAEPGRPYTCKTLADYWGVTPETVRQRILDGSLRAFKVGRGYRIPREAVAAFQEEQSTCNIESDPSPVDSSWVVALGRARRAERIPRAPNTTSPRSS